MDYLKHTFEFDGKERKLFLAKTSYCSDGSLAVVCFVHIEDEGQPYDEEWSDVTVNLPFGIVPNPETDAFVDTNNSPWLPKFLKKNKLAKPLDITCRSGYCTYPAYRFNLDKLREFSEINM